jgi:hypothetical protein
MFAQMLEGASSPGLIAGRAAEVAPAATVII